MIRFAFAAVALAVLVLIFVPQDQIRDVAHWLGDIDRFWKGVAAGAAVTVIFLFGRQQ